ncbi:MAG TPA: HD domain-containing phosphohydrolase [Thermodesulfovibrionales bacterium]|nr:HD domain-containing phosphohydrolase [Thermodesulfovibrionales bacterium]
MFGTKGSDNVTALEEVRKKFRLLNAVVIFVIVTLITVIVRYLLQPVFSFSGLLPDISITMVVGMVSLLAMVGIYLSFTVSRQTSRIIEDYGNRLEKILTITSELREEVHSDLLLEKLIDHAIAITNSSAGSILVAERGEGMKFKVSRGEKGNLLLGTAVEQGKGITGWVAEKGESVRVADVSRDERFNPEIDARVGFKTKSMLCVPLRTKAGVIGVIELLNKEGGYSFRKRDEDIISYLADQAAVSIIKTRFYEDQKNYEIHLTELLLEAMDVQIPEKQGHSTRVATYSNIVARALGISEEEKKKLYFAALLHDVGFLKIKADDAFKKEEFMRHPTVGYEMISPINFYADIAPFILHHHERYDGFGYPSGLKDEKIPREARIIAIAEAFDAMISPASYRIPVNYEEAKTELRRNAGTQFDPLLIEIFIENINEGLIEKILPATRS